MIKSILALEFKILMMSAYEFKRFPTSLRVEVKIHSEIDILILKKPKSFLEYI